MNKNLKLQILLIFFFLMCTFSLKIFMMGGNADFASTQLFPIYVGLIKQKPPMPDQCDQDWSVTKCPKLAVITSASVDEAAGTDTYQNDTESQSYRTMFLGYGAAPKHITVHQDNYKVHSNPQTAHGKNNIQILQQADLVFFSGGDQTRTIRSFMNDDGTSNALLQVIKRRAFNDQIICGGTSAGSMIWGDKTYGSGTGMGILYFYNLIGLAHKTIAQAGIFEESTDDTRMGNDSLQFYQNGGTVKAFGWLPFPTDSHFSQRGRFGRFISILVDLGYKFAYGIDQNTGLYYDNGIGTVQGKYGVTFAYLQNSKVIPGPYFSIQNVHIDYLTSGDKYNFTSKKLISNKQKIQLPKHELPLNSDDILNSLQVPNVITHLVDQVPSFNIGKTKTPDNYPVDTPIFVYNFSKNQNTKGYFLKGNYTVQNVTVDISYERLCSLDRNCRSCDNSNNCQSCFYGMKVVDGRCNCQVNQTFDYEKKYCLNCEIQNCNLCSFENVCKKCNENFVLTNNQCLLAQNDQGGLSKTGAGLIGGAICLVVGIIVLVLLFKFKPQLFSKLSKKSNQRLNQQTLIDN